MSDTPRRSTRGRREHPTARPFTRCRLSSTRRRSPVAPAPGRQAPVPRHRPTPGLQRARHRGHDATGHRFSRSAMAAACLSLLALPWWRRRRRARGARTWEPTFARMSPEKNRTLVFPGSTVPTADDDPTFLKIVDEPLKVGGLIVSLGLPLDIVAKLNLATARAGPAADRFRPEAGTALRLTGGTAFPSNMGVGATGRVRCLCDGACHASRAAPSASTSRCAGRRHQQQRGEPDHQYRSFGSDPHAVARLVSAEVRGPQDNGMSRRRSISGARRREIDSHLALPLLNVPWGQIDTLEFVPFRSAIAANVTAVMSADIALRRRAGCPRRRRRCRPADGNAARLAALQGRDRYGRPRHGRHRHRVWRRRGRGPGLSRGRGHPAAARRPRRRHRRDEGAMEQGRLPRPASTARYAGSCR